MHIRLVQVEGGQHVAEFPCDAQDCFIVGRSRRARCHIGGARYFSRFHFALETRGPRCYVRDLRSVNGTKVNGEPIQPDRLVLLGPGDVVGGGRTYFRVEYVIAPDERGRYEDILLPHEPAVEGGRRADEEPLVFEADQAGSIVLDRSVPRQRQRCVRCGAEEPEQEARGPLAVDRAEYVCEGCREQAEAVEEPAGEVEGYDIVRELTVVRGGRQQRPGGMGAIYEARQRSTRRRVALKTIISPSSR